MKPIIILSPDAMSADDIKLLRDNDLCVVVSKEPARVKFVDPIPCISSRTEIEHAAIRFSRKVLNPGYWTHEDTRKTCAMLFLDLLVNGTPLDPKPAREEVEKQIFDQARADELRRLAQEEARAERAAAKALAASKKLKT